MSDFLVENTVIVLDVSPDNFKLAYKGVKKFAKMKSEIDSKDKISVIGFSSAHPETTKILVPLTNDVEDLIESVKPRNLKSEGLGCTGGEGMLVALEQAIESLSNQIRNISGQINRILLITDCETTNFNQNIEQKLEKAKGLKIFVDISLYAPKNLRVQREDFRKISNKTGGEFGRFFNKRAFYRGMEGFASKKIVEGNVIEILSPEKRKKGNLNHLMDIALDLTRSIPKSSQSSEQKTCQICFKKKSPLNERTFEMTGRFCPHCGTPMHLHCAGKWALKSEEYPQIFRCPYCYTLLKLPLPVVTGLKYSEEEEKTILKMVKVENHPVSESSGFCYYCYRSLSFSEDITSKADTLEQITFKCSNCGAFYHLSCLEDMYKRDKKCANCKGKII